MQNSQEDLKSIIRNIKFHLKNRPQKSRRFSVFIASNHCHNGSCRQPFGKPLIVVVYTNYFEEFMQSISSSKTS